jgi:hypothetical protein
MTQLSWDEDRGSIAPRLDYAGAAILLLFVVVVFIADSPIVSNLVESSTVNAATASFITGIMIGQLGRLESRIFEIIGPIDLTYRGYSASVDIEASAE